MTDPDRHLENDGAIGTPLWILLGLMGLIVVGGLAYGLAHPSIYASNPPQTVGSAASHARSGHPL